MSANTGVKRELHDGYGGMPYRKVRRRIETVRAIPASL